MTTETIHAGRYDHQADDSRRDRNTTREALHQLENALSSPAPGRERSWRRDVAATIDDVLDALGTQAGTDADAASLLSEIAADEPRFLSRIEQLRADHQRIVNDLHDIRNQLENTNTCDIEELRNRLSDTARRYRRHRSQEADLVYEAINVDLGAGD